MKSTTLGREIVSLSTMASSRLYEGYRSNVSANCSGERSNFTGAIVATKKLSNPSSAALNLALRFHVIARTKQSGLLAAELDYFACGQARLTTTSST
jgi:hypothetical protein